jgi:hypothetical protein
VPHARARSPRRAETRRAVGWTDVMCCGSISTSTTNDHFIYNESALRSSTCIDCVRLLRLRSLTMGDNGNSGYAVTQTSTEYFLKQMFMFISCIIMNIVMFYCGLNIYTCTWIVSLTIILKCLLNYGIKICQNIAYHLTLGCKLCISKHDGMDISVKT